MYYNSYPAAITRGTAFGRQVDAEMSGDGSRHRRDLQLSNATLAACTVTALLGGEVALFRFIGLISLGSLSLGSLGGYWLFS